MDFLTTQSSSPTTPGKRSLTPPISVKPIKRKEELIKSFSSSVNIPIDPKQPILPITIPTHLFFDSNSHTDSGKSPSDFILSSLIDHRIDERVKSSSKRLPTDSNEPSTQSKKSKTSHMYNIKEEPTIPSINTDNQATITPTIAPIKKEKPTAK